MHHILLIDRDLPTRCTLLDQLPATRYHLTIVEDEHQAVQLLQLKPFDCVITAIHSPQLIKVATRNAKVATVGATPYHQPGVAHLAKPLDVDAVKRLCEQCDAPTGYRTQNPTMQKLYCDLHKIARSEATVLLTGETGTGKELLAKQIHQLSQRASRPYLCVNCAAIPEALLESEFFGREKGAYTGAHGRQLGRFERAHTGTLLLDEITEMPSTLQSKLLRVLQEGEIERLGGVETIVVDVRIIATSNRDLKNAVKDGQLREDLYQRLHVIPLSVPPLRERTEDILPLAYEFLAEADLPHRIDLTTGAEQKLLQYSWPGNIRELRNVITRSLVLMEGEQLDATQLRL